MSASIDPEERYQTLENAVLTLNLIDDELERLGDCEDERDTLDSLRQALEARLEQAGEEADQAELDELAAESRDYERSV